MSLLPQRKKFLESVNHFPHLWEALAPGFLQEMFEDENLYGLSAYEDKNNNIIVEAEVPGFKKEEISIDLNNGILWITAEKKEEYKERKYIKKSMNVRSYRYKLPPEIDDHDEAEASFEDGIVSIKFRKGKGKESKKIKIRERSKE